MTVGEVRAEIVGSITSFRAALTQADRLLQNAGASAMRAGMALGALGTALAGGMGMAVKASVEFEAQMRNVNSILKMSEPAFRAMSDAVLEMAGRVGQAPEVLARGLYDVASAGYSGAEGLQVLEAAAKAATAGLSDTSTASKAVIATLKAYELGADKADYVSDLLFKTVEVGIITFEELAQNLGDVVGMAATAKVPLEEMLAAIGQITQTVFPAETFTSLNMLLRSIVDPSAEAKKAAADLGLEWNATALASKGLLAMVQELARVMNLSAGDIEAMGDKTMGAAEAADLMARKTGAQMETVTKLVGEMRGLRGIFALLTAGGTNFARMMDEFKDVTGAAGAAFAEQGKSFAVQWKKTWATVQAVMIQFGTLLLPGLKAAGAALAWFAGWMRGLPGPVKAVLAAVTGLAAGIFSLSGLVILFNTYLKATVVLAASWVVALARVAVAFVAGSATIQMSLVGLRKALLEARVAVEFFFISLGPVWGIAALVAAIGAVVGGLILWKRHQAEVNKQTADSIQLTKEQTEKLKTMLAELEKIRAVRARGAAAGKPPDVTGLQKERDLNNEIAEQYPLLLDYYDQAGNAHLLMEKAVRALTAAEKKHLEESRRSAAQAMAAAAQRRSELADQLELVTALRKEFEGLPAGRQETLALHFGPGMTPAEYLKDLQQREAALAVKIREASAEYEKQEAVLRVLGRTADKVARDQAAAQAKAAAAAARATQERLAQIEQEAAALRRLGATAAEVTQWVAMRRLVVAQQNADEVLGIYSKVYEAEGKQHKARIAQIQVEADELRKRATEAKMPAPEVGALVARFEAGELRKLGKERADEAKQHADAALAAEGQLAEGLKGYAGRVAGVREYYHNVRLRQIRDEADEIKRSMIEGGKWTAQAEIGLRELVAQRTAELARDEAREKAEVFAKSADELMNSWVALNSAMRESGRMRTSEYLMQLAMQLDMIRKIHQAQDQMGQPRGMLEKERSLAQTIYSERQRMIGELGNAERRLAEERKRWGQEELEQRKRVHDAELSMISLQFQYERDVLEATGRGAPEALARVARDELAALQQYRRTQMLSAQERLESLQRERELALELGRAPGVEGRGAAGMLEDIFVAMKQAREEMALEERRTFEARKREAREEIGTIEREQLTLREQIMLTSRYVADAATRVFSEIRNQLEAIGRMQLAPIRQVALAGAGGGRVVNFQFYINGQRVTGTPNLQAMARAVTPYVKDFIAEDLEREQRFGRE